MRHNVVPCQDAWSSSAYISLCLGAVTMTMTNSAAAAIDHPSCVLAGIIKLATVAHSPETNANSLRASCTVSLTAAGGTSSYKSAPVIFAPCAIGFRKKNSTERSTVASSVTAHRLFTIRTASSRRGLQLIRGKSNKVIIAKHLLAPVMQR